MWGEAGGDAEDGSGKSGSAMPAPAEAGARLPKLHGGPSWGSASCGVSGTRQAGLAQLALAGEYMGV